MEKITHLWNVNQFITKLNCSQSKNLQTYYIQKCKNINSKITLPSQNFKSSVMCPYCGSLWNSINYSIRMLKGRPVSKSVKKIMRNMKNQEIPISKFRQNLVQKCLRNKRNNLVLKCSVCLKSTKIPFDKPQRLKVLKFATEGRQSIKRHKKKRTKDRTAGLNISGISNLSTENIEEELKEINAKRAGGTTNFITPNQKLKKLNINRLKNIVNQGTTPPKRKSLHSFLTEL